MAALPGFLLLLLTACASGKERTFIGCTPPHAVVRSFLGIPSSDSIDFIRWKIKLLDKGFELYSNYGIGKPNTSGFYDGGKRVHFTGSFREEADFLWLQQGSKQLGFAKLNGDLLHVLDADKSLLPGNGGWSYTINRLRTSDETVPLGFVPGPVNLRDSIAFQGRTPCFDFGEAMKDGKCYKLKWSLVLFADPVTKQPGRFRLNGTALNHQARSGSLQTMTAKSGGTIYQLNLSGSKPMYFVLLNNILVLTDPDGNLLVGNEDFSYTLSRRQ